MYALYTHKKKLHLSIIWSQSAFTDAYVTKMLQCGCTRATDPEAATQRRMSAAVSRGVIGRSGGELLARCHTTDKAGQQIDK